MTSEEMFNKICYWKIKENKKRIVYLNKIKHVKLEIDKHYHCVTISDDNGNFKNDICNDEIEALNCLFKELEENIKYKKLTVKTYNENKDLIDIKVYTDEDDIHREHNFCIWGAKKITKNYFTHIDYDKLVMEDYEFEE